MTIRFFSILAVMVLTSCASTPSLSSLSLQAAEAEAQRDIRSGRMKIYLAGSRGVYAVGVEDGDKALVAKLPRVETLPNGCTHPLTSAGREYARAYNRQIVRHLRIHPHT